MAYSEVPMAAANVAAFEFSELSESKIIKAIDNLDASGSTGCDGISSRILKFYCRNMTSILASLFSCSLRLYAYAATWKIGFITPVHKRGSVFDMNNYRPISILPIISRVFEHLLCKQLNEYLEERHFLSPQQHCFRLGRSCQTALLSLTNRLFCNWNDCYCSVLATLDYSKAFDCLNHDILMSKMQSCYLSSSCLRWFNSYVSGMLQRVQYNNALSDVLPVKIRVPEGSVFGPQLHSIYVNDLLNSLSAENCVTYADDITLVGKGRTMAETSAHLQSLLNIVFKWS